MCFSWALEDLMMSWCWTRYSFSLKQNSAIAVPLGILKDVKLSTYGFQHAKFKINSVIIFSWLLFTKQNTIKIPCYFIQKYEVFSNAFFFRLVSVFIYLKRCCWARYYKIKSHHRLALVWPDDFLLVLTHKIKSFSWRWQLCNFLQIQTFSGEDIWEKLSEKQAN